MFEEQGLGLTIFDIDDTLFRTTAQIKVVKDGKVVRSLNNQQFNTYQLQPGESFDFGEFRNAEKFNRESIPIKPMIAKLKAIIDNAGNSKVIMLTARSDFDNKELFLDTFRQYGIDMSRVHVHRAGNLGISPAASKAVWIRKYLDTGKYARVRLYDDAMSNIKMFIGLQQEYPSVKFFPYFVTHEGTIKTIREDGRIFNNVIDNKNGWGEVPDNREVDYKGLRVMMTPQTFIDLAAPLQEEPSDKILQHIQNGGKIASPFLIIEIPAEWEDGDFSMPARVIGHEGRNRMIAVGNVLGNKPIEVHIFPNKGMRARHITDDMRKMLNKGLVKEKSKSIVKGPLFSLTESILEWGRIVKGVNTTVDVGPNEIKTQAAKFGNTVDQDGRPPVMSRKTKGSTTNVLYNLSLAERYTPMEIACIEGGHDLRDLEPLKEVAPKQPGRLFSALTEDNKPHTEAFDTAVDWVEGPGAKGSTVYAAMVDDAYIEITYKPVTNGVYISFTRGGELKVTGGGSQNKIFGAVINHIKQWVAKNKPEQIVFSAFKPRTGAFGSQDTTRSGLYRKMVQRFASQNGYAYDVEDTGNEDTFILTRQGVEENFADGKKPGRKGLAKRSGVNTKASVSSLRKTAKNSSGEKQRMAHWLANMKAGRAKKK